MQKRYHNLYIGDIRRKVSDFIKWQVGFYEDILPSRVPPGDFLYPIPSFNQGSTTSSAIWMNHSTFLVETEGLFFLTDPIWSNRCSPVRFVGPKRRHDAPISLEDLSKVDVVLISHNHYDHLDTRTVRHLHAKFPHILWVVPRGLKKWFDKRGIRRVEELSWWEDLKLEMNGKRVVITGVPAQHHSGRGLFDGNKTLWMGVAVSIASTKSFYFVGDTGYNGYDFKKIGEKFQGFDLCLCPIGTYKPERFMRTVHSSPEDAVCIHRDVRAKLSLGMHWKTFKLSMEEPNSPPYELYLAMQKYGLDPHTFLPIDPGVKVYW